MPTEIASLTPYAATPDYPSASELESPDQHPSWWQSQVEGDRDGGMSFADFLDIINPLQHIPIVNSIYRAITGDQIGLAPRLLGGTLFGGAIGFAGAGIAAALEEAFGGDPAVQLASAAADLFGGSDDSAAPAQVAAATPDPGDDLAALYQTLGTPADRNAPITVSPLAPLPANNTQSQPGGLPARPEQAPMPAHPAIRPAVAFPSQRGDNTSRQGLARAAGAPQSGPEADPRRVADAASKRIAARIEAARRAEMGLLIASLQGTQAAAKASAKPTADDAKSDDTPLAATDGPKPDKLPALPKHPLLPPENVTADWIAEAMKRGLDSYRRGAMTAPPAAPMAPKTTR